MKTLEGKVAVVAGATRGAGRGIARALGEAGAVVYCAGRTSGTHRPTPGRSETIEETAALVSEAGGEGIPIKTDFLVETDVQRLFERIGREQDRLDLLVNDIWGGDRLTEWGRPFWELTPEKSWDMLETAVRTHLLASRYGVRMMVDRNRGLVIEITDGDHWGYRYNLAYDLAKTATMRLAYSMSCELKKTKVTALGLTPGFLRSEAMLEHFGVSEENWRDGAKKDPHFLESETPLYVGRAVAALAADPNVSEKAGKTFSAWTLAREYGFTDGDGRNPDWGTYLEARVDEILASGEPLSMDQRFLLQAYAFQLDFRADKKERREQIHQRLEKKTPPGD